MEGSLHGLTKRLGMPLMGLINFDAWMRRSPDESSIGPRKLHAFRYNKIRPRYLWLSERLVILVLTRLFIKLRVEPLMQSGQINIVGLEHYEELVRQRKGVLLISNHPSLIEPMLLVATLYKHYTSMKGFDQYFPYCAPDIALFTKNLADFGIHYGRFVPVDRSGTNRVLNLKTHRDMIEALTDGHPLIVFAEGGRTFKHLERGQPLLIGEMLPSGRYRQVAELNDKIIPVAGASGCHIMTVYIDLPPEWSQLTIDEALRLSLTGDLTGMNIYFNPEVIPPIDWPRDKPGRQKASQEVLERIHHNLLFPSTASVEQEAV